MAEDEKVVKSIGDLTAVMREHVAQRKEDAKNKDDKDASKEEEKFLKELQKRLSKEDRESYNAAVAVLKDSDASDQDLDESRQLLELLVASIEERDKILQLEAGENFKGMFSDLKSLAKNSLSSGGEVSDEDKAENRRLQQGILLNMQGLYESFKGWSSDMLDSFSNNAPGLLVGVMGMLLAVLDPETLVNGILAIGNYINDFVTDFMSLFDSDEGTLSTFGNLFGFIKDHLAASIGIFAFIASKLGLLGPIAKGLKFAAMGLFKGLMLLYPILVTAGKAMLAAALSPIGLAIIGVTLAIAAIAYGLKKITEALGFSSIFDTLQYGVLLLKDKFAEFYNMVIELVNKVASIVGKFGKALGFDIDLPDLQKMSTDSAEKFKKQAQARAAEEEEEAKRNEGDELASPEDKTRRSILAAREELTLPENKTRRFEGITPSPEPATTEANVNTAVVTNVSDNSSTSTNTVVSQSSPTPVSRSLAGMGSLRPFAR